MIGYLDLPSGISGDMFLGCLVDAGWPIEQLRRVLERLRLPAGSWSVEARDVMKGVLRAKQVEVRVPEPGGAAPGAAILSPPARAPHATDLAQQQFHVYEPGPVHVHRNLDDIRGIIDAADLPDAVKARAVAVFSRLAHAEAKVHGAPVETVHFHEVGALDAIVDIVGTVAGLHELHIEQLYASAVPLGSGWVNTAHGALPLPAPATLEILAGAGVPTCTAPGPGELVTPTGAALLAELARFEQPAMRLERLGLGAGQKNLPWPNIARLWLGTSLVAAAERPDARGEYAQLETNIDDMNPQFYESVCDRLMAAGALDVWLAPVQMKKGRPGVVLSAIARAQDAHTLADVMLRETTTLGVRVQPVQRFEARREVWLVDTPFGPIQVKLKWMDDRVVGAAPEYEDCRRAAEKNQVPVRLVFESALLSALERSKQTSSWPPLA